MLVSMRFRSDPSATGRQAPRPRLALLPLSALVAVLFVGLAGLAAASPGAGAPDGLGDRIHERFRVWVEDDAIRLRPLEGDPAIRSIRLEDEEEEASVNGKPFTSEELRAFLGKDGELIAELAALDAEGRRAALGLDDGEAKDEDEDGARPGVPQAPGVVPIPPIPGIGQIRVESDGDDRVSFGRAIEIGPEETTGDAVCIGCSITVSGEVEGDAVAVGGTVHVEGTGHVNGNAVGVGGKVKLEPGATVDGDAVAVGGTVQVAEGATVEGQKSTVGWGDGWNHKGNGMNFGWPFWFDSDAGELFWGILRTLFLMMLCCVSVLLARGSMERTSRRLTDEPWKAMFAGLLTQLLFFPVLIFVTVILAVSIVGIPLLVLVPVAVLAMLVAMLLGFAAVAQSLGRWSAERFGWNLSEPFLPVVVGVAMIQGVAIVARLVGLPGGFLGLVAFALVALGFFLKYAAWTMGLGAMTLSLLGRDWRRPDAEPVPPGPSRRASGRMDDAAIAAPPVAPPPPPRAAEPAADTAARDGAPPAPTDESDATATTAASAEPGEDPAIDEETRGA